MMAVEVPSPIARGPQIWPLSPKAYHAPGELGLIPEQTELLYGQVFHKMPKSPLHRLLLLRLLELLYRRWPNRGQKTIAILRIVDRYSEF